MHPLVLGCLDTFLVHMATDHQFLLGIWNQGDIRNRQGSLHFVRVGNNNLPRTAHFQYFLRQSSKILQTNTASFNKIFDLEKQVTF